MISSLFAISFSVSIYNTHFTWEKSLKMTNRQNDTAHNIKYHTHFRNKVLCIYKCLFKWIKLTVVLCCVVELYAYMHKYAHFTCIRADDVGGWTAGRCEQRDKHANIHAHEMLVVLLVSAPFELIKLCFMNGVYLYLNSKLKS